MYTVQCAVHTKKSRATLRNFFLRVASDIDFCETLLTTLKNAFRGAITLSLSLALPLSPPLSLAISILFYIFIACFFY